MSKHSTGTTDLSFLEFSDIDFLPVLRGPDGPAMETAWVEEIQSWPFDESRAQALTKTTGLSEDISVFFFRLYGPENFESAELTDEHYRKYIGTLQEEAQIIRPLVPFVRINFRDRDVVPVINLYIWDSKRGKPDKASREWRSNVYLKKAIRRSLLFLLFLTGLYVGGAALGRAVDYQGMNWVWVGFCGFVLAVGLYVMAGIPGRYRLRKRLAAFMKKEGVPFDK